MLGFIPRELAQYLSPLMDKYLLSFEVICCSFTTLFVLNITFSLSLSTFSRWYLV